MDFDCSVLITSEAIRSSGMMSEFLKLSFPVQCLVLRRVELLGGEAAPPLLIRIEVQAARAYDWMDQIDLDDLLASDGDVEV